MNEEIDESEFYHQDFTTASEWEIFIARLEETIHQWKVENTKSNENLTSSHFQGSYTIKEERIQFVDVEFLIAYYKNVSFSKEPVEEDEEIKKQKIPIDSTYDFVLQRKEEINPNSVLSTWYGLNEYITINPVGSSGITSESQIKVLLSSAQIAISNSSCQIPVFIQIREKWQKCYLGVYENEGARTNFEMIHLRKGPQHCQYLTGLLEVFKTKIASPVTCDPVSVSVQLTYNLTSFENLIWKQELPDSDYDSFDINLFCMLPFGVTADPVNSLILKATWSHLPDHLIVDSENYSDFDPLQAPKWTVLIKMNEKPLCLLAECLSEMLQLLNNNLTMYDVLGDFAVSSDNDIDNPLDLLTESKLPTITTVLKRAARNSLTISKSRRGTAPIAEDILVPILYFLFPDADEDPIFPYNARQSKDCDDSTSTSDTFNWESQYKGFKTCNEDSLPWRLAIVLARSLLTLGGIRSVAHLWFEFVQEMRYRWEKSIPIPGLLPGFPDPRTCLLYQKLQMLNCCIDRKKARELRQSEATTSTVQKDSAGSSTDDEEFFDCTTDKPEEDEQQVKKKSKHSLWNQPVGRLGKFGNLKLIKTGDFLYIPITQEPVPKTEDQLEEDTDVLLQLGTDAQGSELRARMMSASLLSDMESFKAANPESILEDFIRWYSPRDWIEEDELDEWGQKRGHLSSRMLISDNTWVQMWKSAKPVPANRQKRLFDDTREAEKVLHFFDSRTVSQIAEMSFAVLSHAAICRLAEECDQVSGALPEANKAVQHIIKIVEKISRDIKIPLRRYETLVQEMTALEQSISQANSLFYKFNPSGVTDETLDAFVGNLVAGSEVEVEDGVRSATGNRITTMFSDAQKSANMISTEQSLMENSPLGNAIFPQASEREFVMRVSAVRPASYSAKCPQFLRAILSKNEFRLVGAFSEDIVFF